MMRTLPAGRGPQSHVFARMPRGHRRRVKGRIVELTTWWALIVLAELALVSSLDLPEVLAALAIGLAAAVGATAGRMATGASFRFRLRWLAWWRHVPGTVFRELPLVAVAAVRGDAGRWREVTMNAAGSDAEAAARRAFAAMTLTTTPGSIVVDIDPVSGVAVVHEFGGSPSPSALERAVTS